MNRFRLLSLGLLAVAILAFHAPSAGAASLKISPLRYDASLEKGETKKGFVDVTNPSLETVHAKLTVQAFRQIDNAGSLEFYDSEAIRTGVLLDYTEVELAPRETLHLAFVLDGAKLPSGDSFAALFASVIPKAVGAGEQTIRVGTILTISNGTPSVHSAVVENLSGSVFQFGDGLRVTFDVRNTAKLGEGTGFAPSITVTAWPYVDDTVQGPLVFAGRTRAVSYEKAGNYIGILSIMVKTGDSEQTAYRFVVTGYWRFILPFVVIVIGLLCWVLFLVKEHSNNRGA
jgi:hypothetical protein